MTIFYKVKTKSGYNPKFRYVSSCFKWRIVITYQGQRLKFITFLKINDSYRN